MLKNCKKSCSRLEEQKIIRSEHTDTDVRSKMRESLEIKWNHRREPWAGAEASSRVGRGEGAFSFDQTIWTTVELHSHTTNIVNCNCIIVWTQITWVPLLFTILNPPRCSTIAQCILHCLMRNKTTSIENYQVCTTNLSRVFEQMNRSRKLNTCWHSGRSTLCEVERHRFKSPHF